MAEANPIRKNKAQCNKCKDIIESKHRHDFVWCKCKSIFVDGGNDYWKAGFKEESDFIRLDEPISRFVSEPGEFTIIKKAEKKLNDS